MNFATQPTGCIFVLFDHGRDIDAAIVHLATKRGLSSLDAVVIIRRGDLPAGRYCEDAIRELVRLSNEAKSEPARAAAMAELRARFPKTAAIGLRPLRRAYAFLALSRLAFPWIGTRDRQALRREPFSHKPVGG